MIRASIFAFALLAAACTPPASDTPPEQPAAQPAASEAPDTREEATAEDTCGAGQYRALIGTNIAAASFPADANIRVIPPNSPVTMDFNAERLNVLLDANGVITSLECY